MPIADPKHVPNLAVPPDTSQTCGSESSGRIPDPGSRIPTDVSPYPSRLGQTTAGLGLLATANLEPQTVVERFDGPIVRHEQIPEDEIRFALLFSGDDWVLPRTSARYLNHACDANCYVADTREVVTARRVSQGEELTIVYNGVSMEEFLQHGTADYTWDPRWTFLCRCGSPRCIGLIDRYVVTCADDPNSRNLYLGVTDRRGRGVFARRRIAAGDAFEVSPVIVIPAAQWSTMEKTVLYDYTFGWGPDDRDVALAAGYGSFYNHSYAPNAMYDKRLEDVAIAFVALRDIEPGEEVVVNYNGGPDIQAPLWFPVDNKQ
jgi:hypothetical protein